MRSSVASLITGIFLVAWLLGRPGLGPSGLRRGGKPARACFAGGVWSKDKDQEPRQDPRTRPTGWAAVPDLEFGSFQSLVSGRSNGSCATRCRLFFRGGKKKEATIG